MPARFPAATNNQADFQIEPMSSSGDRYVVKSYSYYDGIENLMTNTNLVAARAGGVKVPKITKGQKQGDRYLVTEERLDGETLEQALPKLSQGDIARIGAQLGSYLRDLRRSPPGVMGMLDGRPVVDHRLLKPVSETKWRQYAIPKSDSELRAELALSIDEIITRDLTQHLVQKMPSGQPFTLSHSDIHEKNVIVKDGNFVGLTNWKLAGYYPSWWEYVNTCPLLSEHFPEELKNEDALKWFTVYQLVRDHHEDKNTREKVYDYLGLLKRKVAQGELERERERKMPS